MIPTWITVGILVAGAAAALIGGGGAWTWVALAVFDAAVLGIAIADGRLLVRPGDVRAERRVDRVLSIGERNRIVLRVTNTTRRRLRVSIVEPLVPGLDPVTVDLGAHMIRPGATVEMAYDVRPLARGRLVLPSTAVRITGPLGLGQRQVAAGEPTEVRVYPDVMAVGRYQSLIRRSRLREMGISPVRQRGQGTEFESLRDYVPGDDPSMMEWKATARRGRLISRVFQTERSQTITLCIDAGRLMTTEVGGMSRFDHAVNSALLLAHVALGKGDGVGLIVFGERIARWVPPRKGRGQLARIVEALFDVEPTLVEPSFRDAVTRAAMGRRRSLVVVFTDVSGEETAREMVPYVNRLLPRHLPLVVMLRDAEVEGCADGEGARPGGGGVGGGGGGKPDPWDMAAAANFLEERARVKEYLRSRGTMVLDVAPGALQPRVVNAYLAVKARHLV